MRQRPSAGLALPGVFDCGGGLGCDQMLLDTGDDLVGLGQAWPGGGDGQVAAGQGGDLMGGDRAAVAGVDDHTNRDIHGLRCPALGAAPPGRSPIRVPQQRQDQALRVTLGRQRAECLVDRGTVEVVQPAVDHQLPQFVAQVRHVVQPVVEMFIEQLAEDLGDTETRANRGRGRAVRL